MTDKVDEKKVEDKEVVEEEVVVEKKQDEKQEHKAEDPISELARKMGWNPNHDESDGRQRLSAEEFILKSREIQNTASKHIKKQSREIVELKNALDNLTEHNKAVYQAQVSQLKREVAELKRQRKDAVEQGDSTYVQEIDDRINEINKIPDKLPEGGNTLDPRFVEWVEDNEWYESDNELRAYADMLGNQPEYKAMAQQNYPATLKRIEGIVKKMFPQKFGQNEPVFETHQRRPAAADVESSAKRQTSTKRKWTYNDLTRDQQDLADFYEKRGVMTKDQYIAEVQLVAESK